MKLDVKRLFPYAIILIAFLFITTTIDFQSFWIDEVYAVHFVDRPFIEAVRMVITPENNGPLFYVFLWIWKQLAGPSDFSLRFLSDVCMILAIALSWQLAKTWFDKRTANITACIMALSPFTIWFGQEAKMYAMHTMFAVLATFLLTQALKHGKWKLWLAYGIAINLVGYSHFFGAFTIATHAVLVVLTTWRYRKILRNYFITMGLVVLPYIPVVFYVLRTIPGFENVDNSKGFVEFPHMVQDLVTEFTLRTPRTYILFLRPLIWITLSVMFCGFIYAIVSQQKNKKINYGIWVTGLVMLPVVMYYIVSFFVAAFRAKYLCAVYPFFVMSIALFISAGRKLVKPLGTILFASVLLFMMWGNYRIFTQPALQRSDWRLVADYIDSHAAPNDVVIAYAEHIHRAVLRYYDGDIPVEEFEALPYEPQEYYLDQQSVGYDRMWLVLHQDQAMAPDNKLQEVADIMYPNIVAVYPNFGNIALLGYSMRWEFDALPETAPPVNAGEFENGITLLGYEVDTATLPAEDNLLHPPSNWIHVTTYWQRTGDVPNDAFTPYVHMVDEADGIWGIELLRTPTVWNRTPASTWSEDSVFEIHYDVNLNPVTPRGTYALIVGINQNDEVQKPITLNNGESTVTLTTIEITP